MKQRKDGRWQKSVSIDGKKYYFYSTADTENGAIRDINRQIAEFHKEDRKETHNFLSIAEEVLEIKEKTTANQTYQCYLYALQRMKSLHDYDIENIKPGNIQNVLNELALDGMSYSSLHKVKVFFGIVMDYAIVHHEIDIHNFTSSIKIPKNAKKGSVHSPSDETISLIIKNAHSVDFGLFAVSLYFLGLRKGELLALQRKDVNLERGIVFVSKAVEFIGNQPNVKTPKTASGERILPVPEAYLPYIKTLCEGLKPDDYLFGGEKPLTKCAVRKRWDKYTRELNIDVNPHQLRHAYATLLYKSGVTPKTAQKLLGHSDFSITMNLYTDFDRQTENAEASKINTYLKNKEVSA
jgi:integrase